MATLVDDLALLGLHRSLQMALSDENWALITLTEWASCLEILYMLCISFSQKPWVLIIVILILRMKLQRLLEVK